MSSPGPGGAPGDGAGSRGFLGGRIRFDRHEVAGSFGDLGTDFPLVAGMILVGGLDAASVLILFGVMQVASGIFYGLPMPAQPLKAVAVIVIARQVTPEVLYGGGLAIGLAMLFLTVTGLLSWLDRVLPKSVIRGIQFGLGLQLADLALGRYVMAEGPGGYLLAAVAFLLVVALSGNRKLPPAIPVIAVGLVWGWVVKMPPGGGGDVFGLALPELRVPSTGSMVEGFLVLGLAQIPLSLGNSIFATRQLVEDLFPRRRVSVRKIGFTYSLMNLVSPFLSGIPTCHGSGGLAGHHAFGARTGGSTVVYGALYLLLGLFFSRGFDEAIHLFPEPVLGVILLFEALALMRLVQDMTKQRFDLTVVLLVGLAALVLPYGFLIGLLGGTLLVYGARWSRWLRLDM